MSEEKLISIIIPVYNTKLYVRRCVDSALKQTYKNIEVIVVDDGSDEETVQILKNIETNCHDERLKIIYAKHGGAAVARNRGLAEAKGGYVFWLDSDDVIAEKTIEITYGVMMEEHANMIKIDFTTDKLGLVTMDQMAYMRLLLDDHLKSYVTATLMERSLFNGIRFPEGVIVEDYAVAPMIAERCKKVSMLRRKDLYLYTENRNGSLTQSTSTKVEGLLPRMMYAEERYLLYKSQYPVECENVLMQFANYACMVYLLSIGQRTETAKANAKLAREMLLKHEDSLANSKVINKFRKKEISAICKSSIMRYPYKSMHMLKRKIAGIRQKELWR